MLASSQDSSVSGSRDLDAVVGLRLLPHGSVVRLDAFVDRAGVARLAITLGSSDRCDVVFYDEAVAPLHCLLELRDRQVWLRDCGGGIRINGVLVEGALLEPGHVVNIGRTRVLVVGAELAKTPVRVVARSVGEFMAGALALYGSLRAAAAGVGLPYSTLRGWLARRCR